MKVKSLIALFSLSLVTSFAFASDPKTQQEGIALIQQAIDKTNIFELPAFTMKAKVKVKRVSDNADIDGTYQLYWNGPDQWREQIQLPEYGEIRVVSKGVSYLARSVDFIPVEVIELRNLFRFGSYPLDPRTSVTWALIRNNESVKKVRSHKIDGIDAKCVEVGGKYSREVCVSDLTGRLIRGSQYEETDFQDVGPKSFPRSLRHVVNGTTDASAQITDLKVASPFPPAVFDPPKDAISRPSCESPENISETRMFYPSYPQRDRTSNIEGHVYIDAMIGIDGVPRNLRVVSGPTKTLEQAAMDAFREWRFVPAKCDGIPVEAESTLEVIFELGH